MPKEGYKGITIKEEYFDMAKVLSQSKNLGLGRSVASVVERSITHLIGVVEGKYEMLEEKSFYESLMEYQQNKNMEEAQGTK